MALVTLNEILVPARKSGYAVGAFEFWSLDSAQAIMEAAEEAGMPVILQAGPLECQYAGNAYNLADFVRKRAKDSKVNVALHLDHGENYEQVEECIDAGFTSVMIDASHLPFDENVRITKKVVELAGKVGVSVEAELGRLAGAEGKPDSREEEAMQTDPEEARRFVELTGIDALAVAIGTAHGFYRFVPRINIGRLKEIFKKVDIPLVLHGGSGTPEDKIIEAIGYGIAKINICTELLQSFGKGYISTQSRPDFKYSVPALFGPARTLGKDLVASKIRLFGCIDKKEAANDVQAG